MKKNLLEKLKLGKKPSAIDLENYLKTYHDQVPGMTIDRITRYPTSMGCTSYELLAREINSLPASITIVDLACGNGPLTKICLEQISTKGNIVGVDISEGELEKARKQFKSKNVTFLCERAQSLSLSNHSVDVVLCHLALMLMKPIEPVILEMGRILKPGGLFAGIILVPPKEGTLFYKFAKILDRFLKEEFLDLMDEGFGDARVKTKEGLLSLLPPQNWVSNNIKIEPGDFLMEDTVENLWENLRSFYRPRLLSNKGQVKLGDEARELLNKNVGSNGKVPFQLPFQLFSVKRRPATLSPPA